MKKYIRDIGDTKQKIKITKTTCDSESEISEAIKRSREELDDSSNHSIPSEYNKVDEKITTTVYQVPQNDYPRNQYDRSNIREKREKIINKKYISSNRYENNNDYNTYKYDYNCGQCKCNPKYTERYDVYSKYGIYNNSPKRTASPYNGSPSRDTYTLYNFNNIARNHGYYETKSRSPSPSPNYSQNNCNTTYRTYTESKKTSINKYNNNKCNSRRKLYDDDLDYNYYNKSNTCTDKYYYHRNRHLSRTPKVRNISIKCCHCCHCCHCKHTHPKKTVEYTPISGGRIENYFENEITQDGQYLVTMSLAKKVMDEDKVGFEFEDGNENENEKVEDINEVEIVYDNKRVRDQNKNDRCCKRNKRNNYYTEKIEIDKKDGGYKDIEEKSSTYRIRNKDYGDNYRYYERNENRSPLKKTITVQKRRGPVHIYGVEKYEKNDVVRNYRVNLPDSQEKKVIRTYKKENSYDDNNNDNYEDYDNNYDYYDDNNEKDYNRYEN
jgi:hypothetical protein